MFKLELNLEFVCKKRKFEMSKFQARKLVLHFCKKQVNVIAYVIFESIKLIMPHYSG